MSAALALLAYCAHQQRDELTLAECLTVPEHYDGREVPLGLEARVAEVQPDLIRIFQSGESIDVRVPPGFDSILPPGTRLRDIKPGQYVQARTVFHRAGYLELREIRVAALRKLKILISIPPVVLILVLLVGSLRREKGRLILKED